MISKYNPQAIQPRNDGQPRRDVESLHPLLRIKAPTLLNKFNDYLKHFGLEARIISTLRTWKEQDALYQLGRKPDGTFINPKTKAGVVTYAKGGRSNHNWGVALDIGIFENGKYNTDKAKSYYTKLGPLGEAEGFDWGGRWKSPVDYPHYQYTGTLSNSQFLNSVTLANLDDLLDYKGE